MPRKTKTNGTKKPTLPPMAASPDEGINEAKKRIEAAKQIRMVQCKNELDAVLEKYRCKIVPVLTIAGGQTSHNLEIVADE